MNFDRKNSGLATIPNASELEEMSKRMAYKRKFRERGKHHCFSNTSNPYADRFSLLDEPKQLCKNK